MFNPRYRGSNLSWKEDLLIQLTAVFFSLIIIGIMILLQDLGI